LLEVNGFTKTYPGATFKAADNISFSVKEGEIFGLLGANGAGKSTTIKAIVGIHPIDTGTITINGFDIVKDTLEAKRNMGYVSDTHAVFERLTGREYVNHIANLYDVSSSDRKERAERYVSLFRLEKAFDDQIKSYSHGMKQKISVIAALVHDPKLWILDEPLTGLDPLSVWQLKNVIREHAIAGNAVVFSSHILDLVETLCHKVAIISGGKITGKYTLEVLRSENRKLEDVFMDVLRNADTAYEYEDANIDKEDDKNLIIEKKEENTPPVDENSETQLSDKDGSSL
jgi:ABC-2 type transport system ATP-binding protein